MNALIFLTIEDFSLKEGTRGNILCTNIPGFSFILFYSKQCVHCQNIIPTFKKLPGTITGCQFGMVNISKNRKLVELSKHTIAPISYVPLAILCHDGTPFMRYDGPHSENDITKFIYEVCSKIQTKQKFAPSEDSPKQVPPEQTKKIPEYTIGIPLNGKKNVCYLEFDNAYSKEE